MSWWYAACATWSWLLLVRESWNNARYGINAYIVPTEPMAKFFALLEVFFLVHALIFLPVVSAQWPLLVIGPSYVFTVEKYYAWNFLLSRKSWNIIDVSSLLSDYIFFPQIVNRCALFKISSWSPLVSSSLLYFVQQLEKSLFATTLDMYRSLG